MRLIALSVCLVLASMPALSATLRLGPPEISQNQYRFPVYLQGNSDGVAALDFRLTYDPAVFAPVSTHSGASATSAQKQVSSNVASPGELVVVMMGFNQNSVAPGEVISIVLEKIHEPADGQSLLRIAEPTMATVDGTQIDSRGLARTVKFGQRKDGEEAESEGPASPEAPETPADNPDADGATPRGGLLRDAGGVPYVIAGRAGREATAGAGPAGATAGPGATAPKSPAARPATGTPADPAMILPAGDPAVPVPGVPAPTGTPGAANEPAVSGGGPEAGAADPGAPSPGGLTVGAADPGGGSGAPRKLAAILIFLGLAPVAGFMVYKVLAR